MGVAHLEQAVEFAADEQAHDGFERVQVAARSFVAAGRGSEEFQGGHSVRLRQGSQQILLFQHALAQGPANPARVRMKALRFSTNAIAAHALGGGQGVSGRGSAHIIIVTRYDN